MNTSLNALCTASSFGWLNYWTWERVRSEGRERSGDKLENKLRGVNGVNEAVG